MISDLNCVRCRGAYLYFQKEVFQDLLIKYKPSVLVTGVIKPSGKVVCLFHNEGLFFVYEGELNDIDTQGIEVISCDRIDMPV